MHQPTPFKKLTIINLKLTVAFLFVPSHPLTSTSKIPRNGDSLGTPGGSGTRDMFEGDEDCPACQQQQQSSRRSRGTNFGGTLRDGPDAGLVTNSFLCFLFVKLWRKKSITPDHGRYFSLVFVLDP